MTNYRRHRVPGGTYFFTVAIAERRKTLLLDRIDDLRNAIDAEQKRKPFSVIAMVILPDHLHAIWQLPPGDVDYSDRWRRIKAAFSKELPAIETTSASRRGKGERGIWQRRFWEHAVRDDNDLQRHIDYVHFNPMKHGYVSRVAEWPHSTFHAYVARGVYSVDWAGGGADDCEVYGERD
ncbi:MAG TPA: transposase [Burkholderiales bacterium]